MNSNQRPTPPRRLENQMLEMYSAGVGMKHNVIWVKKLAKKIKKVMGVPHHVALDLAAQEIGFQNWKHFLNDQEADTP